MGKSIKRFLFAFAVFCVAGAFASGCSTDADDELEKLNKAGCGPSMPGWPGCLSKPPGDSNELQ